MNCSYRNNPSHYNTNIHDISVASYSYVHEITVQSKIRVRYITIHDQSVRMMCVTVRRGVGERLNALLTATPLLIPVHDI